MQQSVTVAHHTLTLRQTASVVHVHVKHMHSSVEHMVRAVAKGWTTVWMDVFWGEAWHSQVANSCMCSLRTIPGWCRSGWWRAWPAPGAAAGSGPALPPSRAACPAPSHHSPPTPAHPHTRHHAQPRAASFSMERMCWICQTGRRAASTAVGHHQLRSFGTLDPANHTPLAPSTCQPPSSGALNLPITLLWRPQPANHPPLAPSTCQPHSSGALNLPTILLWRPQPANHTPLAPSTCQPQAPSTPAHWGAEPCHPKRPPHPLPTPPAGPAC